MDKFGELLVELRQRNGLSQKSFAEALNISTSSISKWEHNQNYPDLSLIPHIAEILNISCDELLRPTETLEIIFFLITVLCLAPIATIAGADKWSVPAIAF